ncbi:MAG: helix-turn-helix transcriptional regulator [Gammaproteobacteria bacterium]|nr:helix-turn-helix transcriptional regulator [Gammaproteobacteria bacterium]MBU1655274.1 helix-turn-helix transcriptional regulator [Gammaproteobacteria bacterium]MBU1962053.1 helix-turn-helix transcriptional regulator [Gammaproteobacteria bacterium]
MQQFSDRITFARKRLGLSQAQLASILGVSRGACGQWEQGVSTPSVNHMIELAKVTEVSFEWLATGRGNIEPDNQGDMNEPNGLDNLSGRPITGDLRETLIWLQKLPIDKLEAVLKLLRSARALME